MIFVCNPVKDCPGLRISLSSFVFFFMDLDAFDPCVRDFMSDCLRQFAYFKNKCCSFSLFKGIYIIRLESSWLLNYEDCKDNKNHYMERQMGNFLSLKSEKS